MLLSIMENLPAELKSYILLRLPLESLLRFRCVCKSWRFIIDDPFLRQLHTKRLFNLINNPEYYSDPVLSFLYMGIPDDNASVYSFHYGLYSELPDDIHDKRNSSLWSSCQTVLTSYPIVRTGSRNSSVSLTSMWKSIVGSCNGLVCIKSVSNYFRCNQFQVVNPVTRECLDLPAKISNVELIKIMCGFGYNHSTNEYKVVRICCDRKTDNPAIEVEVYTIGSCKWRKITSNNIAEQVYEVTYCPVHLTGVPLDGALHWINYRGEIIQFDLATEEFRFPFPRLPSHIYLNHISYAHDCDLLVVSKGMLCAGVLNVNGRDRERNLEVWVIRNGTWRKEMVIRMDRTVWTCYLCNYQFVTFTQRRGKAIVRRDRNIIVCYDTVDEKFTTLHQDDRHEVLHSRLVLHVKSFVSLTDLGENPRMIYAYNEEY